MFSSLFKRAQTKPGLRPESKSFGLTDPETLALFMPQLATTGFAVGPHSAMQVPAVACAVGLIAESVGNLPAKLHSRADKAQAPDHPAHWLIHDEANEWTSAQQLRTEMTTEALLRGASFAEVVRSGDGAPRELHRLDHSAVSEKRDPDGTPFYEVGPPRRRLGFQDVLHVRCFGAVSPILLAKEAISLALAFEAHIASLFANGGRPSGIILAKKVLDTEAKKKIAGSWFQTHSGRNSGGTAILDEEMTYQALSTTLADAQFAENRLEQIREIARAFRVPPTMLFELTRGTWSNTEEMARQFYAITLKPWLATWATAYSRCLLSPEERKALKIEFVTDDLLTTNSAARAAAYGQYRSMGAMTANEVRAGLNLPEREDGNTLQNPYTATGAAPAEPNPEAPE